MTKERELLARAGLIIAQYRWSDPEDKGLHNLSSEINAYFEEPEGNELGVSEKDKSRLFYGFLLDCNAIGPESAGVNLATGIKALLKHHKIGGGDE